MSRILSLAACGAAIGAVAFALAPLPGLAADSTAAPTAEQGQIVQEVVVTARRRPEDNQRVPIAIAAFTGDALRVHGVESALDLQNLAPSLTVSGNLSQRDNNVYTTRGQSQPFGGADPGVQTYFAEVPFNGSGPGTYYDMENVQVLNGPQGTLFGRNTTGGAVLFEPNRPADTFEGYGEAGIGNYNLREAQAVVNVPVVTDKLMVRLAGNLAQRDGFTTNVINGERLDDLDFKAWRASAIYRSFNGFENYLVYDGLIENTNGTGAKLTAIATQAQLTAIATGALAAIGDPDPPGDAAIFVAGFYPFLQGALAQQNALGPRKTTSDIPLFYKRESWGITDIASYDFSDNLRIRNIFGYRSNKEQPSFDFDGSVLPILDIVNNRTWEINSIQVTDELQLLGNSSDKSFTWIVGFYHELDHPGGYAETVRSVFGGAANPPLGSTEIDALDNQGTSNALFGQGTYDLSGWIRGLSFTAGGRYTWDHKVTVSNICFPAFMFCPLPLLPAGKTTQSANFAAPSWTLGFDYQANDQTMLYVTYRRGYKSGGFNAGAPPSLAKFQPEYLTDVEVGDKSDWNIGGIPARTNFDAYYGWYSGIQKNDFFLVPGGGGAVTPVPVTLNAARATIKGIELQATVLPAEGLELSAFYSYTDAAYQSFITATGNHTGDPFAFTPRNKFGFSASYHLPVGSNCGDPVVTVSWYQQSKVWLSDFADLEPDSSQAGYGLLNARFDWNSVMGSSLDASLFVNNATDKVYKIGANALMHLTGTSASIYGPPLMWGFQLRYRFGAPGNGG